MSNNGGPHGHSHIGMHGFSRSHLKNIANPVLNDRHTGRAAHKDQHVHFVTIIAHAVQHGTSHCSCFRRKLIGQLIKLLPGDGKPDRLIQ